MSDLRLIDYRYPGYLSSFNDWAKWRLVYDGGEAFRSRYLKKFTNREDEQDFIDRKLITPIATQAKSAVQEIRNSIFQRMHDIVRVGGSAAYQRAVAGVDRGVDRRGSTMNYFMGVNALEELLVMGQVGIYVDAPPSHGETLADTIGNRPYLYTYCREDILSYACNRPDDPSQFSSVLLRDTYQTHGLYGLPNDSQERYRLLWLNDQTGLVNLQFYDANGAMIDRDGNPGGPVELQLMRIPFVLMSIGDGLLKGICDHQIALLNLGSSDVSYALKANFPFLVEQRDLRAAGSHLRQAATQDGTATSGGQGAADRDINVGPSHGRAYDKDMNQPAFIHPSPDPLKASLLLQDKLESDIRKAVHLSVATLSTRASAESKSMDNQGLESGLSFIGLQMEATEREVVDLWSIYENRNPKQRQTATIKYPDRYSLKTDENRIDEADKLSKLMNKVPGRTIKREIAKQVVDSLFGGKRSVEVIDLIKKEIDDAPYVTSDPQVVIEALREGAVGEKTASIALGFPDDEYLQARQDHIERATRIAEAQASVTAPDVDLDDPGARGVDDLESDSDAAKDEKKESRDQTFRSERRRRVRGRGRQSKGQ